MKKARRIITAVMLATGVAFLLAGCVMGTIYERRTENMVAVTGRILAFRQDRPLVTFTYGGRAYTVEVNQEDSGQRIGDKFPLMVNPENPYEFMTETLVILMWVFVGVDGVSVLTGLIIPWAMGRGEKRRELLISCGRCAPGVVTEVAENANVSVNNRHPHFLRVRCKHPLTGEEVTVRSHSLWGRLPAAGDRVNVFFDPMNEKRYAVDWPDGEEEP